MTALLIYLLSSLPLLGFMFGGCCCGGPCSETICSDGGTQEIQIELTGYTNGTCANCTDLNGVWIASYPGNLIVNHCTWEYEFDYDVCGVYAGGVQSTLLRISTTQVSVGIFSAPFFWASWFTLTVSNPHACDFNNTELTTKVPYWGIQCDESAAQCFLTSL
jgi:hypothetical protein